MKNKKFTLYDATTGMVLSSGECAYPHLIEEPGVAVLIGEAYSSGWIEHGEHFSLPECPSSYHVFDYSIKQWVDLRTLDEIKKTRWDEIKKCRGRAENFGFIWNGLAFDSDPVSQQRIQGAAQLAALAMINNQPFSIDWTLADNSVRTLNAQEMIAVGHAMAAHINQCHQQGRALRALIEAATTKEEVEAITWNSLA